RHTSFSRDWSSDVCSSDLDVEHHFGAVSLPGAGRNAVRADLPLDAAPGFGPVALPPLFGEKLQCDRLRPLFVDVVSRKAPGLAGEDVVGEEIGRASCRERA